MTDPTTREAPASAVAREWSKPRALVRAVAPCLAAGMVRLVGATLRLSVTGTDALAPLWHGGRPLIYVAWHGRVLMMPWINAWLRRAHGVRRVTVLTSHSRDGEMMARYVRRFGLDVVRGSSSRGGASALRSLAARIRTGEDVAVVPDGPRGPARRLGAGVVGLAVMTGAPVVAIGFGARPAKTLDSWDRFVIPAPFARAAVVFGSPLTVDAASDREQARRTIEAALDDATASADRMVGA
jgi:lysophospholipid acyltransferase (LPLAT)-like uncharacterized protein